MPSCVYILSRPVKFVNTFFVAFHILLYLSTKFFVSVSSIICFFRFFAERALFFLRGPSQQKKETAFLFNLLFFAYFLRCFQRLSPQNAYLFRSESRPSPPPRQRRGKGVKQAQKKPPLAGGFSAYGKISSRPSSGSYPFTAPAIMPLTSLSWKMMKSTSMGRTDSTSTVRIRGMSMECSPLN